MKPKRKLSAKSSKSLTRAKSLKTRRNADSLSHSALTILLSETIGFLMAAGLPISSLRMELRREAARLGSGRKLTRPKAAKLVKEEHEELVGFAGVIHDWHRHSAYTNRRTGEPRPLRADELKRLIGTRFAPNKVARILRRAKLDGFVRKIGSNHFLSTSRHIVLTGPRASAMERAAALVPQYLKTALKNADTKDHDLRDFDRDARVFYLPEKWLGLWKAVVRERTESFLEGIDNWLEDHSETSNSGRVREVAVHCYSYTGDPQSYDSINENREAKSRSAI